MKITNSVISVVVAHPDDEILGMGGTIAKLVSSGNEVNVVIFSKGVASRDSYRESENERIISAEKAATMLGIKKIYWGDFPDNELDTQSRLTLNKWLFSILYGNNTEYIFTHSTDDLNIDHRLVAESCLVAARPKPESKIFGLFHFEVASSTNWKFSSKSFRPQFFVDVTKFVDLKNEALSCYQAEINDFPDSRSLEGINSLMQFRGTTVGVPYAEAFEIGMLIDKT